MKTTKIKLLIILLIASFTHSCSKDDEKILAPIPVVYEEENPLTRFLTTSGLDQQSYEVNGLSNQEAGFSFRPTVKGRINALVLKSHRTYITRVTIWNKLTETVLRTELVNINVANADVIIQIPPLELEINKEYFISINNKYWFERYRTDAGVINYPISAGNISITGCRRIHDGINQTFPSQALTNSYKGDCSFKFQRTE